MKSSYLKLAVAGVLSLAGAQAMALAPSDIDSSVVALYVSGATATDNAFDNLAKLSSGELCKAGTLDIYAGNKTKVLFCTAGFSGTGITSGTTKIAVFKESNGGSAYGISNVGGSLSTNMSFIDFFTGASNVSTACATAVNTPAAGDFATFNTRTCSSPATLALAPDAGISDIDPGTFVAVGTGSGVTNAHVTALTHKRQAIAVTFNPIVSTTLFSALQTAQGYTAGDTTSVSTMPTLSSSQVRGIFQGMIADGSQIYTNGTALGAGQIYICRRGNTSGTMASFKVHYLNQGCTVDATTTSAFVKPDSAGCETAGCTWASGTYGTHAVFAGAGSGDVRSCVDYHSSLGHYAIGVASTESKPGTSSNRFRYIKVDSAEPTLKAVMEGRYDFFTENSWNDKLSTSSTKYTVWNQMYSKIGTSAVLKKVNESWYDAAAISTTGTGAADTGLLDLPNVDTAYGPAFPITNAGVRATPINSQTRTTYGLGPNACNRTYSTFP